MHPQSAVIMLSVRGRTRFGVIYSHYIYTQMPIQIIKKGQKVKHITLHYLDEQIVLPVPVVILSACRTENESQQKRANSRKQSIKYLQF